jgi:hypothetical protein
VPESYIWKKLCPCIMFKNSGCHHVQLVWALWIVTSSHSSHFHCRLWDLVPQEHLGIPQYYVVHAWSGSFQDLAISLHRELCPDAETSTPASPHPNMPGGAIGRPALLSKVDLETKTDPRSSIYIWLGKVMNTFIWWKCGKMWLMPLLLRPLNLP